jgi:hypothetical protein
MELRNKHAQQDAAARAGISERTARRIDRGESKGTRSPRRWRTRTDPLEDVWEPVLQPMLEEAPALKPVTLLEALEEHDPEVDWRRHRRTLERRVRRWRAQHGPDKTVMFPQSHPPGRIGLSDFTDASKLEVRIGGKSFPHLLYHFTLAASQWEHVEVVVGGESYVALAECLQNALWALGGVPEIHRTDSLSAAYRNLDPEAAEDLTRRYRDLCAHYGMTPSRNNRGEAHENGSVEGPHGHLKTALDQALLLRGSRDFEDLGAWRRFVAELVGRRNARRRAAVQVEAQALRPLPVRRTDDFEEAIVQVTSSSAFTLRKVFYTVPSRLIGHRLKVRLYDDRLECFLGTEPVLTLPRGRATAKNRRGHVVDYRHVLASLKRKPQALTNLSYRDALLPGEVWRRTFEALLAELDAGMACRTMVGLLSLAHDRGCEGELGVALGETLERGVLPDLKSLTQRFAESEPAKHPVVTVELPTAAHYEALMPSRRGVA